MKEGEKLAADQLAYPSFVTAAGQEGRRISSSAPWFQDISCSTSSLSNYWTASAQARSTWHL